MKVTSIVNTREQKIALLKLKIYIKLNSRLKIKHFTRVQYTCSISLLGLGKGSSDWSLPAIYDCAKPSLSVPSKIH